MLQLSIMSHEPITHLRAAIALLVDTDLGKRLASFTLRCRYYGFDWRVLQLPAHVSLKQPCLVHDLERFEAYFEALARRIEPQQLRFDGFVFWGDAEQGVVSARVVASPQLRQLHARLNTELEHAFGGTQADHDGDSYEFHLTIAIGASRADLLPQLRTELPTWRLDEVAESSRLALFIYEESTRPDPLYGVREYGTYKILPLRPKIVAHAAARDGE
jgi:2'-5' RNA ligase